MAASTKTDGPVTKDDADLKGATPPPDGPPSPPMTLDAERGKDLTIERLSEENRQLRLQVEAYEQLDRERTSAEKQKRLDKANAAGKVPIAKMAVVGVGRRMIAVGESLSEKETEGLTEGVHFDLVSVA